MEVSIQHLLFVFCAGEYIKVSYLSVVKMFLQDPLFVFCGDEYTSSNVRPLCSRVYKVHYPSYVKVDAHGILFVYREMDVLGALFVGLWVCEVHCLPSESTICLSRDGLVRSAVCQSFDERVGSTICLSCDGFVRSAVCLSRDGLLGPLLFT